MTVTWADDPYERRRSKSQFQQLNTNDLVSRQRDLREKADALIADVSAHLRRAAEVRPERGAHPSPRTET